MRVPAGFAQAQKLELASAEGVDTLYKFRSYSGPPPAMGPTILKNSGIYLSTPSPFNDPFDGSPIFRHVTWRVGVLNDSTAIARKIGTVHRVVVAAPAYLARAGTLSVPGDLRDHAIIVSPAGRVMEGWTFRRDGKPSSVRVQGRFILNGMEAAAAAAIAGLGILSTGDLSVMSELETGRLVRVRPDWKMGSAETNVVLPAG